MNPQISIITSTYNAADTFPQLIASMRNAKTSRIQWIVVDGASTDSTTSIAKRATDVIDVFVTEPDEGIYDAWNKALQYATGDYIAFIGADDYISPIYFREALAAIDDRHNIICFKIERVGARKARILHCAPWMPPRDFPLNLGFHHQGTLHSSVLFEGQRFNKEYRILGDQEFLLRNWRKIRVKVHLTESPLLHVRIGGVSSNTSSLLRIYDEKMALLRHADVPRRWSISGRIALLAMKRAYVQLGLTKIYCSMSGALHHDD